MKSTPQSRLVARPYPASLCIVIPVFNEQAVLPILRDRLTGLLPEFNCPVEILAVDDGSSDGTLALLLDWAREDAHVSVVALSRNFGHQAAATAGLDRARGEAIVLMDGDLQDPPELMHEMIRRYQAGYDVVYAQRTARKGESVFKRLTAWLFYVIMRVLLRFPLPRNTGDYRLISRECLRALQSMRETHRFLRGMVAWVGYPSAAVQFLRSERAAGTTKYPLSKMLRFAWIAAISFSPAPLRTTFALGVLIAFFGIAIGLRAFIYTISGKPVVPGWTSIMVTLCLIGSCILMCVGVVGEYVARLYEEAKDRPLYVVQERLSLLQNGHTEPGLSRLGAVLSSSAHASEPDHSAPANDRGENRVRST
jgi:glycosyltransferase involved in cell wall biosynthesis